MDTLRIAAFLERQGLVAGTTLIAAISGGTDSTALLVALRELGSTAPDIIAAHVNHHLRGAESDEDEAYVRALCARLEIPFEVADGTLLAGEIRTHGVEGAAREVRSRLLLEIRRRHGAHAVATAHQKNDQAETVLMRLLSGSAIGGLRAIHPIRDDGFVRPMLDVTRDEVEAFLAERRITPRFDRMNDDPRFLRTRIRRTLREYGPEAIDGLAALAGHASAIRELVERELDRVEDVETSGDSVRFCSWPADPFLRRALLLRQIRRLDPEAREIGAADLDRLERQLQTFTRTSVTKTLELVRQGDVVLRRRKRQETEPYEVPIVAGARVDLLAAGLSLSVEADSGCGFGDPNRQPFSLPTGEPAEFIVRNRRAGDTFQPLGMAGRRKVKDILIDRKISAGRRDTLPLLVWRGEIIWIAGVSVSERVRIGDGGDRYATQIEPLSSAG